MEQRGSILTRHFYAEESKNIYMGLAKNRFNPIEVNSEAHSVWSVIVTPYN